LPRGGICRGPLRFVGMRRIGKQGGIVGPAPVQHRQGINAAGAKPARIPRRRPTRFAGSRREKVSAQCGGGRTLGAAAVAQLVMAGWRISTGHLLERLVALTQRCLELDLQTIGGGPQVVPALAR